MPKHNPGPWEWVNCNSPTWRHRLLSDDGHWVFEPTGKLDEELEANMRLIAAAPELLEALRFLVGYIRAGDASFEELHQAESLLARIEGPS